MSSNNWDSRFEEIVASYADEAEHPVRRLVGEEAYAEMMQMARATNMLTLRKDAAQERYLNALGNLHTCIALFLIGAFFLGTGWSIYAWI